MVRANSLLFDVPVNFKIGQYSLASPGFVARKGMRLREVILE